MGTDDIKADVNAGNFVPVGKYYCLRSPRFKNLKVSPGPFDGNCTIHINRGEIIFGRASVFIQCENKSECVSLVSALTDENPVCEVSGDGNDPINRHLRLVRKDVDWHDSVFTFTGAGVFVASYYWLTLKCKVQA